MDKEFVSFLLQCDNRLEIGKIFWYQPAYLISPHQKSFADLFTPDDRGQVAELIAQTFSRDDVQFCSSKYHLISPRIEVALCVMRMGAKILIYGQNTILSGEDKPGCAIKEIVFEFMKLIRATNTELLTENEKMIRNQFEQIQKLNNNLLNMQRQLKKANAMLNQLNKDLNNRLVKDSLTGLVSRYQYRQEIELMIAKDPDRFGIFIFIDLDDFKSVNDNYGHRVGDEYLKGFAGRLTKLPFSDLICMRIAGDEFGLYIHGYEEAGLEQFEHIWSAISSVVLHEPVQAGQTMIQPVCSAGMAVFGKDTKDVFDLIEYADQAMYNAKRSGKNTFRVFDNTQDKKNEPQA
jgi:diguanylate cyclase (GGDEF)-like protein